MKENKAILIILDGWGIGDKSKADVIHHADTPYVDSLMRDYPNSQLATSGEEVGLPNGQMGNSEVGHLNIGAGRIVYQDLVKINKAIETCEIRENKVLVDAFTYAKEKNKSVHFMGLVSNGGVHSSDKHLKALCSITQDYDLKNVFVHAFMDGRDTDPKSGAGFVKDVEEFLEETPAQIASVIGRFYAMDRDKRWERVKVAYNLLVNGKGAASQNMVDSINESYNNDKTDEFIEPIVKVDDAGNAIGRIKEGDVIIFFNYRNDRAKELTAVLTQQDMPEHDMKTIPLHYCTMTPYDATFKGLHIIFDKDNVKNTMGEYLAKMGKKQLRIAETEKYAHVTFFFSGGRETEFDNEKRVLISSPKVNTYDLQPEMSAYEVKDAVVSELNKQEHDFVCLNFANGDMVGHTGNYEAILKALKAVDNCVKDVVEAAKANGYTAMIIADHGNADNAVNTDGSINTAHSTNPVPCILVTDEYKEVRNGVLADVAPTLLKIIGLEIPKEMTGKVLVS